jgi:uncharacterized membrane protein
MTTRPRSVTDLVAIVLAVVVYVTTVWLGGVRPAGLSPTLEFVAIVRAGLGLFLVLIAPGYVALASLGPEVVRGEEFRPEEKAVLALVTSLGLVVVQGVVLGVLGRFRPDAVVLSTVVVVSALTVLAGVRRALTGSGGVTVDLSRLRSSIDRIRDPPRRAHTVLNLILVALVVGGVGAAVLPSVGEENPQFTEFAVLAEDESGDRSASDVASVFRANGSETLVVTLTNREREPRRYHVVVQLQRAVLRDRSVEVLRRERIETFETRLSHDESVSVPYEVQTAPERSRCRIAFLLYVGSVPDVPSADNAYRELHLWDGQPPASRERACPASGEVELAPG